MLRWYRLAASKHDEQIIQARIQLLCAEFNVEHGLCTSPNSRGSNFGLESPGFEREWDIPPEDFDQCVDAALFRHRLYPSEERSKGPSSTRNVFPGW